MRGEGVAGPQPINTAVHKCPNKLWRPNSIYNLCASHIEIRRTQEEIKKGGVGLEPNNTVSKITMGSPCFSLVFPRLFNDRPRGQRGLRSDLFLEDCGRRVVT
jgi:hypothetical protein